MAKRGSTKWFSQRQEARVAKAYGGRVSPSSGAAVSDEGDVRTKTDLIECKHTGTFASPKRSISFKLEDFEKAIDEARMVNRDGFMCLSIYSPESPLANDEGCVDVSVRPMLDDAYVLGHARIHEEYPYG